MPNRHSFAAATLLAAAVLFTGCTSGGRITPQARDDIAALRQMTAKVSDATLREEMRTRLASLKTEMTADNSLLGRLWPQPGGVVKLAYHPFTCTGYRNEKGEYAGIEVRVKPLDANGQVDRIRGKFRFELSEFIPANELRKGKQLGRWEIDLSAAAAEKGHWEQHSQSYLFQLQYPGVIEPETKFVITTLFTNLADRRVFLDDVRAYRQ